MSVNVINQKYKDFKGKSELGTDFIYCDKTVLRSKSRNNV